MSAPLSLAWQKAAALTRLIKLADVYDNLCDAGNDWDQRRKKAKNALSLIIEFEEPMLLAGQVLRDALETPPSCP
jgi:hypothetical protein